MGNCISSEDKSKSRVDQNVKISTQHGQGHNPNPSLNQHGYASEEMQPKEKHNEKKNKKGKNGRSAKRYEVGPIERSENNRYEVGPNERSENNRYEVGPNERSENNRSQHPENRKLHEKLRSEEEKMKAMSKDYERKKEELRNALRREQDSVEKSSKRKRKIEDIQKELKREENLVKEKSDEIQSLEYRYTKMRKEIDELKKDNNELRTRLSRMAAAQLTDNNPNIADLSDENRPTKLGERYAELYDNQWTDAFSELAEQHHVNERDAIVLLKDILVEGYQRCKEYATSQLQSYKNQIKDGQEWKFKLKDFKDARKKHHMVPQDLEKDFRKTVTKMLKEKGATEQKAQMQDIHNYMDEVLNLCWLSQVQDPPMAISWDYQSRSTFPGNLFRAYTETGDLLDFVVWPALFLHQDGPVINKGVAQGTKGDNARKEKKQPDQKMVENTSTLADLKTEVTTPSEHKKTKQSSSNDNLVMEQLSTTTGPNYDTTAHYDNATVVSKQRGSVDGAQHRDGSKPRMPAEGANPGAMNDGQRTADNNTHRDAGNKTSRSSHSDQQTPKGSNPAFPGKTDGATPVSEPKGSMNDSQYRNRHNPGTTTEKQNTALSLQNSPRVTENNKSDQGNVTPRPLSASMKSKNAPVPPSKEQSEKTLGAGKHCSTITVKS